MARVALATQAQVVQTAKLNTVDDAGGSNVVDEAIDEASTEVTDDYGDPSKRSTFVLDNTQARYEFRADNKKAFRIDRVFIRDSNNNRINYTAGTASEANKEYTEDLEFNTISFASDTLNAFNGNRVEVHYVMNAIHQLVRNKAALFLLESTNVTNATENTPVTIQRIMARITRLQNGIAIHQAQGSSNNLHFDPTFGEVIPQTRFWTFS